MVPQRIVFVFTVRCPVITRQSACRASVSTITVRGLLVIAFLIAAGEVRADRMRLWGRRTDGMVGCGPVIRTRDRRHGAPMRDGGGVVHRPRRNVDRRLAVSFSPWRRGRNKTLGWRM